MKIAIPLKMKKIDSAIAPLFGQAQQFAIVENNRINIVETPVEGGKAVAEWLANEGVEALIIQEMGRTPFETIENSTKIKLFHTGFERITLENVLVNFHKDLLAEIDEALKEKIIAQHEEKGHGKHHHDHDHHHDVEVKKVRVVFPTDENNGYLSKRGAHFGKANYYTIVTLENDKIADVESVENGGHSAGACGGAVANIMSLNPDALVVSGIGGSPAQGFADAGLDVYFDRESSTVEESVNMFVAEKLEKSSGNGTCSAH